MDQSSLTNNDKGDSGVLKYVIAALVLGSAVSNIFVAHKMKFFHISTPFKKPTRKSSTEREHSSTTSQAYETFKKRLEEDQRRERMNNYKDKGTSWINSNDTYPKNIMIAMTKLNINESDLRRDKIKQSYQKLALTCHPDTIPYTDTIRKKELEQKFQGINDAYRILINFIDKNKTA